MNATRLNGWLKVAAVVAVSAAASAHAGGWPMGGGDIKNTHSSNDHKISTQNVASLTLKWELDMAGDVSATPTVEGDALYVPDFGGQISRIDSRTGAVVWTKNVAALTGVAGAKSRTSPALLGDQLIFGTQKGAMMVSVRKDDGSLLWKTQLDAHPLAIITSSPVVKGNRVYGGVASLEEGAATDPNYNCCSFRGSAFSLDARTGKILWKTFTVPEGYTGGSIWGSTPVIDEKRHQLIAATGNNYSVPPAVTACVQAAHGNQQAMSACTDTSDFFDAVVAFDLDSGYINWGRRMQGFDAWTVACFFLPPGITWCPSEAGPDYDFGAGPNLFTVKTEKGHRDLVGAGQKSGIYWALDPENGDIVWNTLVGPGSALGGIEWGAATDGDRIYVQNTNLYRQPYVLQPSGGTSAWGAWSGLDAATGKILWQTPDPTPGAIDTGYVSTANGVVYAGSLGSDGWFYAMDAATGAILWSYKSGGSVAAGAAIVDGTVYWG